jgi:predicted deacetylase
MLWREQLDLMQPKKLKKFLLRFDDLCPTMNWPLWSEIEAILVEHRVRPILAVVPDNQDPKLRVGPPVEEFWEHVRRWQQRGWSIAMHGYQHRYVSRNSGLVALRKLSEFAGLPPEEQEDKLRRGAEVFRQQGIHSRVWIAPGHTFDQTTVALLPQIGIQVINDGYFRFPYCDANRMTWLPQQLGDFRPVPAGVWTICCHHNEWTSADLRRLRANIERHQDELWSLDEAVAAFRNRRSVWSARLCTTPWLSYYLIHALLKAWRHGYALLQPDCAPVETGA